MEESEKKMLSLDCMKKSERSEERRSPEDRRRSSVSPDDPRRSASPVEIIDAAGATGSPPRTPTPEPTASPLELLEAPMAREDGEEEEEEAKIEDGSSSSSSPSSPKEDFPKEFAQSPPEREEQLKTKDIHLASSIQPNLNLTQNHKLNQNLNQKPNIVDEAIEIDIKQHRGGDLADLQRAEPATIIVSPHNEMAAGRMELSPVQEGSSPSPEPHSKQARAHFSPVSAPIERSPSPARLPTEGSLSPEQSSAPLRSSTPERKDSRGSHGSSSYDEERASSLSPEPTKAILAPNKVTSPMSPPPSQPNRSTLTKIYTEALGDSDSEERREKVVRNKPAGDITAMYTQKLVEREELSKSPKPERRESMFQRPEGMTNITQLYTAALKEDRSGDGFVKPVRSGKITKLYTEGFSKECGFKGKPSDEVTNPRKVD